MIIIVGLGNPGQKFEKNRHNLGFMALDIWALKLGKKWHFKSHFKAEICTINSNLLLAKPQTFMNQSGESVAKLANFYKIKPENIWVIHDELDLPLGKIRLQMGGQTAGHKGLDSIKKYLKSLDFIRFRLGIGHNPAQIPAEKYVLQNFSIKEMGEIKLVLKRTIEAMELTLKTDIFQGMSRFN